MSAGPGRFPRDAARAIRDPELQDALGRASDGFVARRREAVEALPEYEDLRAAARAVKDHTLAHLDRYLERFEARASEAGVRVHWALDGPEACEQVLGICREAGARRVVKGKSMASEEIGLNGALEQAGLDVTETDLGEYIIQLAGEPPSHIIAPAVHKTREAIARLLRDRHGPGPALDSVAAIVDEARGVLRERFLAADVGITGANLLVAETGSAVLVTNEGNGDLCAGLPRVHVVLAAIDKLVPTLEDAATLLRLLPRSATGQQITAYTSLLTGPRRSGDGEGPEEVHLVLLDNGRSDLVGGEFEPMLRCIRCGACLNHCPVYAAVGGHAYGWVYPGPMGAVLTPLMRGLGEARHLPEASTLCGRCETVCPMSIPLPQLLRQHREAAFAGGLAPARTRMALRIWGWLARRPALYRLAASTAAGTLARMGRRRGRLRWVPFAAGWTASRDLPAPEGETFARAWRRRTRTAR